MNRVCLPSPARRASEAIGKFGGGDRVWTEGAGVAGLAVGACAALGTMVLAHSNAAAHKSAAPQQNTVICAVRQRFGASEQLSYRIKTTGLIEP